MVKELRERANDELELEAKARKETWSKEMSVLTLAIIAQV